MESTSQVPPGGSVAGSAFLLKPPGKGVSIYIEYDVVDRLGFDVMKGFGAVPKRGAEIGGILLGTAADGEELEIRIEDFVSVPCEHLRGPSFILSDADLAQFDEVLQRWQSGPDRRIHVVGFFRSSTRETLQLGPEDLEILDSRFPAETAVCLLIRPYATRVSEAAFLWRQDGKFSTQPVVEVFPFRRKELGGARRSRRADASRPGAEEVTYDTGYTAEPAPVAAGETPLGHLASAIVDSAVPSFGGLAPPSAALRAEGETPVSTADAGKKKGGPAWVWIPLSFVFLLLGVVLGFQIAISFRAPPVEKKTADPYDLGLAVAQTGDSLNLKWNVAAPPIKQGLHALLVIQDGSARKLVELSGDDMARGGVLYRNNNAQVQFRLEVTVKDKTVVAQSVESKLLEPAADAASSDSAAR